MDTQLHKTLLLELDEEATRIKNLAKGQDENDEELDWETKARCAAVNRARSELRHIIFERLEMANGDAEWVGKKLREEIKKLEHKTRKAAKEAEKKNCGYTYQGPKAGQTEEQYEKWQRKNR